MKHEISLVRLVNPAIDGSFSVAGSLVVVVSCCRTFFFWINAYLVLRREVILRGNARFFFFEIDM